MKNFRIIRFAVTLSLIVTMMAQPMVAAAVAAGCGDSGCQQRTQMLCDGCGRCDVAESSDSCCCCGESEPKATTQPSDCGHDSPAKSETLGVASVQVIQGVCLCGLSNPPMDRGSERQRISEPVEVRDIAISFVQSDNADGLFKQSVTPVALAATGKIPRFSQRLLCVWRI